MKQKDPQRIRRTEQAIERYTQTVYGIALTQLKYRSDADDVFQDVFMTYFTKAPDFADSEHEKAWLIRTTINLCRRADLSPWRARTISLDSSGADTDRIELSGEEEQRVFAAVREIKEKYRLPLYLHYFEGMPVSVIARSLRISEDAVRKQLSRARAILRQRLERDYFE